MAGQDLTPIYQAAGREWNVDPALLQAVAGQESGGTANPDLALSPKGAQGRMQIMPATGQAMGMTDPSDPLQSIYAGAKYLSQQLDRYGTPELGLAAYNAGPGRVDDYLAGKSALPAETVNYVPSIARRYQAFAGRQQPAPDTGSAPAVSSLNDTATANLDSRMSQFRAGGGQPTPAPAATGPTLNVATGPIDYFSQAKSAALAASGGAAPPTAIPTPQPAPTPASGQPSATAPGSQVDYFSMAKAAAQAAAAAPAAPVGPVTPVSMPGTAQPTPATPAPAPGIMGAIGSAANAVGQQASNFAEGAGHAVLQASRGLYGAIDYGNRVGPAALAPDGSIIDRLINPAAATPNLDAENAEYAASGVGNTLGGEAGNLVGQTVLTLPALGGLGGVATAAGRGIAAGADAVSPAIGAAARNVGNLLTGTASTPGNMLTQAVVRPTSLAANGAAQGAVANAITGDPNNTLGQNLLMGAGAGAALGPAAAAVGAAGRGTWNALAGTFAPFYAAGRGAIADTALARLAADGPLVADATSYVPGVTPTLAQATANPGLAGAERAVASVRPNQFTAQAADNNDARTALVDNLRKTPTDIQAAEVARDTTAVPAITGALASATGPADASPVVSAIDQILASPAGQRDAVQRALGNVRGKLVQPAVPFGDRVNSAMSPVMDTLTNAPGAMADAGLWDARDALIAAQKGAAPADTLARLNGLSSSNPTFQATIDQARSTVANAGGVQSDPAQLYGIRKAINDSLSPLAANAGSDAQLAASELQQVKAALDNSIEGAAPGFKSGIQEYANSSRPIDAMNYLQSKGYTSADGTVTLAKVRGVLDDIAKQQALPGARDAKSVPQSTVDSLQGLYADLLRQNNSRLGMQPGSNTFQNLATSSTLANYGAPLAHAAAAVSHIPFIGNMLTGSIGRAYEAQNAPILDQVVNRLLNPEAGAVVLDQARQLQARQAAGPAGANALAVVPGANLLTSPNRAGRQP